MAASAAVVGRRPTPGASPVGDRPAAPRSAATRPRHRAPGSAHDHGAALRSGSSHAPSRSTSTCATAGLERRQPLVRATFDAGGAPEAQHDVGRRGRRPVDAAAARRRGRPRSAGHPAARCGGRRAPASRAPRPAASTATRVARRPRRPRSRPADRATAASRGVDAVGGDGPRATGARPGRPVGQRQRRPCRRAARGTAGSGAPGRRGDAGRPRAPRGRRAPATSPAAAAVGHAGVGEPPHGAAVQVRLVDGLRRARRRAARAGGRR